MKAPPTIIFVSINLFFKELKEYYNPPISDLLRREGEREKEREGGRKGTYSGLQLISFHSFLIFSSKLHPNNFLAHSCLYAFVYTSFMTEMTFHNTSLFIFISDSTLTPLKALSSCSTDHIVLKLIYWTSRWTATFPHLKIYSSDHNLFITASLTLEQ